MKNARQQKKAAPTQERVPAEKKSFFKSEWPLLLFPTLVLMALAVLFFVNRSIQQEHIVSENPKLATTQQPQTANAQETSSDLTNPKVALTTERPTPRRHEEHPKPTPPQPRPGQIEKTQSLLASLSQALEAQDHATIKQCMKDLVDMGDSAVEGLGELVLQGDSETARMAAEALARIGTPFATSMLLTAMEEIEEGPFREQLAKEISTINNHESWPMLMDTFLESGDAMIQRAVSSSLARMADTAIVDEIVALYDAATTEAEMAQLARLLSNINSSKASQSLLALAGDVSSKPQNSLQSASIEALANIGDPKGVSYLLQKLEASSPGEGSYLYTAITGINQPQAQSALLYAAAGNKEVSAEQGRTAAIYALGNYPNTDTYALLQQIAASEDNTAVITAAVRTLERIEASTPTLADTMTSKASPSVSLPTTPLKK